MDIISRLKYFLDTMNIPNSQFADNCKIPRPTISQVLNGRNKKISDELISKIHATYPTLSVMWLLFGEGNMLTDENIKISGAQNRQIDSIFDSQFADNQQNQTDNPIDSTDMDFQQEKKIIQNIPFLSSNFGTTHDEDTALSESSRDAADLSATQSETHKQITNIVVFYSDNSFQSFSPSQL